MQNSRLATRPGSRRFSFNRSQKISEQQIHSHDSQSKQSHQEAKVEKVQKEEEEEGSSDWRSILAKMNQSVSEVKALPKEPDPPAPVEKSSPSKDFTDIKLEYRRIKIREQCQKLNTKVNIPSRSSWRDRINGGETASEATPSSATSSSPDSDARRNLTWGQRRTKVYHINSDIEVHKFKIIDTIHLKRSQIEARLAEYNNSVQNRTQEGSVLMLTYTDQEYLNMLSAAKAADVEDTTKKEVTSSEATSTEGVDPNQDQNLDGLSLKDNTKKKLSQFNKNISDNDKALKVASPTVPKKKKYNSSVDWREELKNRDRAKQLEDLKRYKVGMPDYKEPEKEKEEMEAAEEKRKAELKTKSNWKRISLKPTTRPDEKKKETDSSSKPDEPFKVSLRPVRERKANRNDVPSSQNEKDVLHQSSSDEFDKGTKEKNERTSFLKKNTKKENTPPFKKSNSKQELDEKPSSKKKCTEDKQYVIKIINFVAIKVPVEENKAPPRTKKKIDRKPSTREKPPIPKVKPPALPKDTLDFSVADETELESFECEIANALEDEQLNTGYLKDLLIEIIRDNPDLSKAEVKKAKVQTCPKPKVQSKQKDGQSFEDKYFKPKRKKMLDYFPEPVPLTLRKPEEIRIEPMKFSSVSDNCVTKSLFIGSQYTGQRH